jgi:hypothetical protein
MKGTSSITVLWMNLFPRMIFSLLQCATVIVYT